MQPKTAQSSFIPKRGTAQRKRRRPVRKVFLFTILTYSLIFAALLAAGASFLYKNYVTTLMQDEVTLLNDEINTFSVASLATVTDFDLSLKRVNDRLDNTASIHALLEAIEVSVAEPVQLLDFSVERIGDSYFDVSASVLTQSFDGALFQRKLFNADQNLFSQINIEEVTVSFDQENGEDGQVSSGQSQQQSVDFLLNTRVPISVVPYTSNRSSTQFSSENSL